MSRPTTAPVLRPCAFPAARPERLPRVTEGAPVGAPLLCAASLLSGRKSTPGRKSLGSSAITRSRSKACASNPVTTSREACRRRQGGSREAERPSRSGFFSPILAPKIPLDVDAKMASRKGGPCLGAPPDHEMKNKQSPAYSPPLLGLVRNPFIDTIDGSISYYYGNFAVCARSITCHRGRTAVPLDRAGPRPAARSGWRSTGGR